MYLQLHVQFVLVIYHLILGWKFSNRLHYYRTGLGKYFLDFRAFKFMILINYTWFTYVLVVIKLIC
jgi:hypothetical protein